MSNSNYLNQSSLRTKLQQLQNEGPYKCNFSSIEGFILVVHTSLGGDQLAFRYPPVTRTSLSKETWSAVIGTNVSSDKMQPSSASIINELGSTGMGPGSMHSHPASSQGPSSSSYISLDSASNLSSIGSGKVATGGKGASSNILSMNQPSSLMNQPQNAPGSSTQALMYVASGQNVTGMVGMGGVGVTSVPCEPPSSLAEYPISISYSSEYTPYDMPSVMLCNILSPKQSLCDKSFHTIIDQFRFFGFPTQLHKEEYRDYYHSLYSHQIDMSNSHHQLHSSSQSGSQKSTSTQKLQVLSSNQPGQGNTDIHSIVSSSSSSSGNLASSPNISSKIAESPSGIPVSTAASSVIVIPGLHSSHHSHHHSHGHITPSTTSSHHHHPHHGHHNHFPHQLSSSRFGSSPNISSSHTSSSTHQESHSSVSLPSPSSSHHDVTSSPLQDSPVTASLHNSSKDNNSNRNTSSNKDDLTMFHLVMVVPKEVSREVAFSAQKITIQIASALKHEQERCHYVSDEVFKMMRIREKWLLQHRKYSQTAAVNLDPNSPAPSHTALTYDILQTSSLARLIKDVYHSLRDAGCVQNLLVNNRISLSLNASRGFYVETPSTQSQLHHTVQDKLQPYSTSNPSLNGESTTTTFPIPPEPSRLQILKYTQSKRASPFQVSLKLLNDHYFEAQNHNAILTSLKRPLRPYHALLLFNPTATLDNLHVDASPTLKQVVETASPVKSFRDLQLELGIPLPHLYRIAAHLQYWKHAKIIDVLTRNNMYLLNPRPNPAETGGPDPDSDHLPFLCQSFQSKFPSLSLLEILSKFCSPRKLSDLMVQNSNVGSKFVDIVTWLMRRDLITQIHSYYYLTCPSLLPNIPSSTITASLSSFNESSSTGSLTTLPSFAQPKHLLSPSPLVASERIYLDSIDNGTKEYKVLRRLCPYFRGAHHLTEICWREQISKEEFFKVVGMYKNIIITMQHPEPDFV